LHCRLAFLSYRRRPGWWSSAAGSNVAAALASVFFGRWDLRFRGALGNGFVKELLQERSTPTASGSSAEALAELRDSLGLFNAEVVQDLALGYVKAKAQFVVEFHGKMQKELDR